MGNFKSRAVVLLIVCAVHVASHLTQFSMASPREMLELRLATFDDLDDITDIVRKAFETDPEWNYRYPYRHEYPEDHWTCTREQFQLMLEAGGGREGSAHVMHVVTLRTENSSERAKPIAVAVWDHPRSNDTAVEKWGTGYTNSACNNRRDANVKHVEEFNRVVFGAKKDFFDDVYGNNQIHLEIIATHPDYQGHGAGSKLTRWGIETASREGHLVTLIASPGAMGFYEHLGFTTVFNLTIQLEGEVEKVEASGMELGESSAALE